MRKNLMTPFHPTKLVEVIAVYDYKYSPYIQIADTDKVEVWQSMRGEWQNVAPLPENRPTFDSVEGLQFFDAQYLADTVNTIDLTNGFSIYFVRKLNSVADREGLFSLRSSLQISSTLEIYWQPTVQEFVVVGNRVGASPGGAITKTDDCTIGTFCNYQLIVANNDPNNAANFAASNNVELLMGSGNSGTNLIPDVANFPYIGLGFWGSGTAYLDGAIRSLVICNVPFDSLNNPRHLAIVNWQRNHSG